MIQITPLPTAPAPRPEPQASAAQPRPLCLKPVPGRTPLSRWLRSGAAKPQKRTHP